MKLFAGKALLYLLGTAFMFNTLNTWAQPSDGAEIPPVPQSIGALGDSMTAAALAKYKRQDGNKPWVQFDFLMHLFHAGLSGSLAPVEFRELSWSTGTDDGKIVISHARRLAALRQAMSLPEKLKIYNASVSGNEVNDVLTEQLPRIMDWSRQNLNGREAPEYVTILIGANDVCAADSNGMTSVNDYYNRLNQVVDTLLERSKDTHVLLLSLPNIERLRAVAKDAMIWGIKGFVGESCEQLWKTIKLCPTLTTISDPSERAKISQRVIDYNAAMQDIAAKERTAFGDRVRYVHKVYETDFNKNDLSLDCFHPNPIGQNILSKGTWDASWWAPLWLSGDDAKVSKQKKVKVLMP